MTSSRTNNPRPIRYGCLNVEGVRAAMVLQPGATSSLDLEKRDRKMAKVIIDIVGLEPEKYRLGYTKVTAAAALSRQSSPSKELYLLPCLGAVQK